MFECVTGMRGSDITGCILADCMGLGKTLQTISLMWTLLRQSPNHAKRGFVKKVIIVVPLTLVRNWQREFRKWLDLTRISPQMAIGGKEKVQLAINNFIKGRYKCLVISYEQFRIYATNMYEKCDLLIFDEGHRLKNKKIKMVACIEKFPC